MAGETTTLEKVLLGDTIEEVVKKINAGVEQTTANATHLSDFKDDLQDGSVVVHSATNSIYATYDSEETGTDKTTIPNKYVTKSTYTQKIGELEDAIANAGQVADVQDSDGKSIVTNKVAKLPKLYTKDEIDDKLAGVVGGMQYVGTLGTGGTVTALPTADVKSGYTYKVITAGTYANQAADVGDLFIATVKNNTITWTLVPSGDDGDVYAEGDFSKADEIIVAASAGSKKVKSSGYTISGGGNDNKNIPTVTDVKLLIDTTVFRQDITANGLFVESRGNNGEYYYKRTLSVSIKYSFSVFDRNASPLVVGIHRETDGTVVITSDRSLIDLGAYVVCVVAKW